MSRRIPPYLLGETLEFRTGSRYNTCMVNKLPTSVRADALHMLVEGSSMSSVSRVLGIDINTIVKLLRDAGDACIEFHDRTVRDVHARYVQVDEMWSYIYARNENLEYITRPHDYAGTVWTWTAIDTDTKLVISWMVGGRGMLYARSLMTDLYGRVANRIQLSTDGYRVYPDAVDQAFGGEVDYVQRIRGAEVVGNPNMNEINGAYVERQNLTMRMSLKRLSRSTNAFSKTFENHRYALALYFVHYNFCRPHKSLGTTPAVKAGLAEFSYEPRWIVELINERTPSPRRGPYRKRQLTTVA